jgi:hypothetical protein
MICEIHNVPFSGYYDEDSGKRWLHCATCHEELKQAIDQYLTLDSTSNDHHGEKDFNLWVLKTKMKQALARGEL